MAFVIGLLFLASLALAADAHAFGFGGNGGQRGGSSGGRSSSSNSSNSTSGAGSSYSSDSSEDYSGSSSGSGSSFEMGDIDLSYTWMIGSKSPENKTASKRGTMRKVSTPYLPWGLPKADSEAARSDEFMALLAEYEYQKKQLDYLLISDAPDSELDETLKKVNSLRLELIEMDKEENK